jgi:alkanesulfonate monooxygenase SsuD/methylene tetrahydromethanopterin reductase-like flavin-dependent oxidoreductase (luciferase family)
VCGHPGHRGSACLRSPEAVLGCSRALGVIVTSNRLRPPTVLAKMAATTDIIAGGRLVFGIGAGGALLPPNHPHAAAKPSIREYAAYGIPLVPAAEAIGDLAEACRIFRRMWTEPEPVQKPHPPIMIGPGGEKLGLRVVAQHADLGNCPTQTIEEFPHIIEPVLTELGR